MKITKFLREYTPTFCYCTAKELREMYEYFIDDALDYSILHNALHKLSTGSHPVLERRRPRRGDRRTNFEYKRKEMLKHG